jgi:hypothetical protein
MTPSQDIVDGLVKALEGMLLYVDEPADTDSPLQMAKEIDRIEFARAALAAYRASLQNDGWNEWKGGECPVEKNARVEYRLRFSPSKSLKAHANVLDWGHADIGSDLAKYDIIAWRLAK